MFNINKFQAIFLSAIAMSSLVLGNYSHASLPIAFNKTQIEANVLKKFVSLQSERTDFYRITDIQVLEEEDNTYHKPGYIVKINYETPTCKNNYFKGLAFSVTCDDEECPFGMVYKKCF